MCLMPLAERMLNGALRSRSSTLSDCQAPLEKPRNVAPLNVLPPSFSTLFRRIPPPEVSAGIPLVMTLISDCSMSSKYDSDGPSRLWIDIPSTSCSASLPPRPWARSATCSVIRDPPISGVPGRTPATTTPIDMTLRDTGSASITSRVSTCVRDACSTSTCGDCPDTMSDSSSAPILRSAFTVTTVSDGTSTPVRVSVLKPVSENVSL